MICVLLAAGYATRMYPLTLDFPKPLLDVGGKTILDWMVDDLAKSGKIERYVTISNHFVNIELSTSSFAISTTGLSSEVVCFSTTTSSLVSS